MLKKSSLSKTKRSDNWKLYSVMTKNTAGLNVHRRKSNSSAKKKENKPKTF